MKRSQRDWNLLRKYNITQRQVDAMAQLQHERCAICSNKVPLVIDHDHDTGQVRALLCTTCNTGLGMFKDNPKLLTRAMMYLEAHGKVGYE